MALLLPALLVPVPGGGIRGSGREQGSAGLRAARTLRSSISGGRLRECRYAGSGLGLGSGFGFGLGCRQVVSRSKSRRQAGRDGSVAAVERLVAASGYLLPLLDGVQFGRFLFLQFPESQLLLQPLVPLLQLYNSFPYSNLIAFFTLYLAVVRNPSFSRYVRFNSMQAVVLDVLLILPSVVERTFQPRGGIGFQLLVILDNTVFLFLVACFLFGVSSCMLGKTPRLPLVADAADAQVY